MSFLAFDWLSWSNLAIQLGVLFVASHLEQQSCSCTPEPNPFNSQFVISDYYNSALLFAKKA